MTESIAIDKIIRSKRRTLSIEVHPQGEVIVRAPIRATKKDIHDFITDKLHWINKTLLRFKKRSVTVTEKHFISGEGFLFLGQSYVLQIIDENHSPFVFDEGFIITTAAQPRANVLLTNWYKEKAHELFHERLTYFAPLLGVNYQRMRLSSASKRWGSCSMRGNINLNWRLIMAPISIIDYVIVHELAHLREMNHSPRFWQLVSVILPDYAQSRAWLREFGDALVV